MKKVYTIISLIIIVSMGSVFDTYSAEDLNAKIVTFKVFIDGLGNDQ